MAIHIFDLEGIPLYYADIEVNGGLERVWSPSSPVSTTRAAAFALRNKPKDAYDVWLHHHYPSDYAESLRSS